MSGEGLGLVETIGLAAAVEAADAAVKSANVGLLGYELTRGGGMVTVKIVGDVGAVQTAVAAAAEAACKVSKVWATHIIPRPHRETEFLIQTSETVGITYVPENIKQPITDDLGQEQVSMPSLQLTEQVVTADKLEVKQVTEQLPDADCEKKNFEIEIEAAAKCFVVKEEHEICNLCGDPGCPRKKGDSKILCIHYKKKNKEG